MSDKQTKCAVTWNPGVWPYVTHCVKPVPHVKRGDMVHTDRHGRTIEHEQIPEE